MRFELLAADSLDEGQRASLKALSLAVYPPASVADWPGRALTWAPPQWRVLGWDEQNAARVHVGAVLREATLDDRPLLLGGIGGVMTHPEFRRAGWAARAMEQALDFFALQEATVALLVCEPALLPLYTKLGWQAFTGEVRVSQAGQTVPFVFNQPMVCGLGAAPPTHGVLDLRGAPW